MSQWDKLIRRILNLSKDVRFEELKKILERYGYSCQQPGKGSSHYVFRKPGAMPITVPRPHNGAAMKRVYVEAVRDIVLKEMEHNEDT